MVGGEQIPCVGHCFASRKVAVEKQRVGLMYREAPDSDHDSGWRFLCGDETQEYLDGPGNVVAPEVQAIVELDREVAQYLHLMPPVAFARPSPQADLEPAADHERQVALDKYTRNLSTQLALNPDTWRRLLEAGVSAESHLSLQFKFRTTEETAARALAQELQAQGCTARAHRAGLLRRGPWIIEGSEQPDTWTLDKLNQWVYLMVLSGKRQQCDFDGWSITLDAQ